MFSAKGCTDKRTYRSRRDARKYARWYKRHFHCKYATYLCPDCGQYHLTTNGRLR